MASPTPGELYGKSHRGLNDKRKERGAVWETAFSYIYEVAAERNLLPKYIEDDYLFEIYQNQVSINNKL